ncbi:MAG: hypothetical protein JNL67_02080 [Planctomycetaceae bacterium]|nr:hypothetical protein [Planctomycetaceae bacterium]
MTAQYESPKTPAIGQNSTAIWQTSTGWESVGLAVALTVACIVGRLWLDQPNFKPSMAAAILAGMALHQWRLAVFVPLFSAIVTDMFLGTYELPLMIAVYACSVLPVFWFRVVEAVRIFGDHGSQPRAMAVRLGLDLGMMNLGAVVAAVVFYGVTSFVVWSATPWYPAGMEGLTQAYWNAIPFLRWMVQGNLVFLNALAAAWLAYRALSMLAVRANDAQPVLPQ